MPGRDGPDRPISPVSFNDALKSFAATPTEDDVMRQRLQKNSLLVGTFSIEDDQARRSLRSKSSAGRGSGSKVQISEPNINFKKACRMAYQNQQPSLIDLSPDSEIGSRTSERVTTVLVAKDGGVRNIKDKDSIYRISVERRSSFYRFRLCLAFAMIGLNFYAIGYTNISILRQQSGLVGLGPSDSKSSVSTYSYFNTSDTVQCRVELSDSSLKTQCGLRLDNQTHFREPGSHIGRCCIFYSILPIAVAFYELVGFVIVFIGFLRSGCKAVGPTDDGGDKWLHLSLVAWSWLRMLSRFSAVMFLGHIHPSIILDAMHKAMEKRWKEKDQLSTCQKLRYFMNLARTKVGFITTRLMLLLIGAVCVTVKIENVHYVLEQTMETARTSPKWIPRLFSTGLVMLAFLNQMMNMLDISHRLRLRALAFVFAGEDAIYQQEEMVQVYLYQTNVARVIWEEFAVQGGSTPEENSERSNFFALAVLFCFNHQDVQRLAVKKVDGRSYSEVESLSLGDMWH